MYCQSHHLKWGLALNLLRVCGHGPCSPCFPVCISLRDRVVFWRSFILPEPEALALSLGLLALVEVCCCLLWLPCCLLACWRGSEDCLGGLEDQQQPLSPRCQTQPHWSQAPCLLRRYGICLRFKRGKVAVQGSSSGSLEMPSMMDPGWLRSLASLAWCAGLSLSPCEALCGIRSCRLES